MHHLTTPVFRSVFDLPASGDACIYGAGKAGQALGAYLRRAGRPAVAFIDTYRTGDLDGLPILPPATLTDGTAAQRPAVVLIATFDRVAIARMLIQIGGIALFDAYGLAGELVHEARRMATLVDAAGVELTA